MNKKISFSLLILLLSLLVGFTFIPHKKELSFNEYQEKHSGETFYVVLKRKLFRLSGFRETITST